MQKSLIRPQSKDAGKETPHGQAFVADAYAPKDVALDELEEVGAMAVDKAAEEEGKTKKKELQAIKLQRSKATVLRDKSPRPLSKRQQG